MAELDCFRDEEAVQLLDKLGSLLDDPTSFVTAAAELGSAAKQAAKAVFDHAACQSAADDAKQGGGSLPTFALPELHVDGFDTEQIWLQIDLSLDSTLKRCKRLVKNAAKVEEFLQPDTAKILLGQQPDESPSDNDEEEDDAGDMLHTASDKDSDDDDLPNGEDEEEEEEEEEGEDVEGEEDPEDLIGNTLGGDGAGSAQALEADQGLRTGKKKAEKPTTQNLKPGEDRFLRFEDMDKFLQDAEDEAARSDDEDGDEDDEEDEEGGFDDMGLDSDASDAELEAALERAAAFGKKSRGKGQRTPGSDDEGVDFMGDDAKYGDFFGEEEEDGEQAEDDDEDIRHSKLPKMGSGRKWLSSAGGAGKEDEDEAFLSSFERQQRKLRERIADLENTALGQKPWEMKGEVSAKARPLNSALEADLDFETGVRGAPELSEETAESIEEMIKRRCAEGRFDDVIRVAAPPPEKKKVVLEMDDKKSSAGLGELYEKEFVRAAAGGSAEDKDDPIRQEARQLFGELCGKLDALSHFHFTPKPVIEELVVRAEVPALAMEEALPTAVSTASLKAPEETFKPTSGGELRAAEELTPAERKTARAKRKRISRRKQAEAEEKRRNTAAVAGGLAQTAGRKSETSVRAAAKGAKKGQRSEFVKSGAVFSKLQDQQNALKAGIKIEAKPAKPAVAAAALKL